ncbi:PAS/PAC domain protein [Sulfitobacter noctilucicola]|uniref:PAS domain-containing protein n=1 Tax=Sulfitobacter noctilucicola TaxID=1342301 RepID=A0A7W6M6K5_9RHOB|nr:PAS-domain containing protein [Sulfitobacter noctilucicola]KIN62847.1 PAS/PAC domain protein [Sulfitobacter noctilucicola]MBB4172622.1 PAS domain-containing protein [Sulfitobacter noctilucicola]
MLNLLDIILIVLCAGLTAAFAVRFLIVPRSGSVAVDLTDTDPVALLFDNGVLHHGTFAALSKFSLLPGTHVWDDLRDALLPRFPDFPETSGSGASGSMALLPQDPDDPSQVKVKWRDGFCWVTLSEQPETKPRKQLHDTGTLEQCAQTLAHPAWEVDHQGRVIWSNPAYDSLERNHKGAIAEFNVPLDTAPKRLPIFDASGRQEWYEVSAHFSERGTMHHATRVTTLMHAEEAQRTFVQTLAKTFAHLSIGLAIFDDKGQLSIFNPALVDLTDLQATFLATRPTMLSFFDALRENRRMPEPKNYKNWRQDIAEVIAAASGGQYRETWTLADGRTYTVQGRPHPDGATAFLIEDISAEVTMARSYRAEVEQFEVLLDSVDDALVVFSNSGVLTFSNATYRTLWGQNPDAAFADVTLEDALELWSQKSVAGIGWSEIRTFCATLGTSVTRQIQLQMNDGREVRCTLRGLPTEATLIQFTVMGTKAMTKPLDLAVL